MQILEDKFKNCCGIANATGEMLVYSNANPPASQTETNTKQEQVTDILDKVNAGIDIFGQSFSTLVEKRKEFLNKDVTPQSIDVDIDIETEEEKKRKKMFLYGGIGLGVIAIGVGVWYFYFR